MLYPLNNSSSIKNSNAIFAHVKLCDVKFLTMNSIKQIHIVILYILCFATFYSCKNDNTPNVSKIKIDLESRRLDKDLYALDTNNIAEGLKELQVKYPDFLGFYLDTLMGFSINGDFTDTSSGIRKGLHTFLTHEDYRGVFDSVFAHYPDEQKVNSTLTKGFQYQKHYFPDYEVPNIVYFISGLNNYGAITYGTDIIGVGLDMFLGSDYPFYRSVGIPEYFSTQLTPDYIPVAVFRTVYRQTNPFAAEGRVLLDMMIQNGKEMYYTKTVLPFVNESTILAYTPEQLAWCEENEAMVFDFFVRKELLYENNLQKVIRYVMDGPSATGMPPESPGNIGAWLGLQIVESYMHLHPEKTLKELVEDPIDAQRFLLESKYKPQ